MIETESRQSRSTSDKVLSVCGIIACIILVPILTINLILIIQGFTQDSSTLPNIAGYFPLMVRSGSMSSAIEEGDLIIVHTVGKDDVLQVGDIVTYWDSEPGSTLITHRIIAVTEDDKGQLAYRTRGDANNATDYDLLYPDKVVGIFSARIPYLGNVALFMQTIPGVIVCVVLPLALFVIYDVIRRRRIESKNRQEADALMAELEQLKQEQAESTGAKKQEPEEKP